MKKYFLVAVIVLNSLNNIGAMDVPAEQNQNGDKGRLVVYSHGFGEPGYVGHDFDVLEDPKSFTFDCFDSKVSFPVYPDAPGQLDRAVFYTKPAVLTLAEHLNSKVKAGHKSIALAGRSCGAGTAINCLAKLAHYDPEYFQGSAIKSKEDADNIVAAVNNGAFIATAPFMGLRKANAIAIPSSILAGLTVAAGTAAAYHYAPSVFEEVADSDVVRAAVVGIGAATYYAIGGWIKNMYAQGIVHQIVPRVTNGHFDPTHADPLESVESLRGKLTCPTLLHFHQKDVVLENPDQDTIKLYDALKGDKTHVIITDDAWHNAPSQQFGKELKDFNEKYFNGQPLDKKETQPSVDELKQKIYPQDMRSRFSRNKYLFAGTAIAGTPLAMRLANEMLAKE